MGAAGLWEWKHGNNPNKGKPGAKAFELIQARKGKSEARAEAEAEAAKAAKEAEAAAAVAAKEAIEAEKVTVAEAKAAEKAAPAEEASAAKDAKDAKEEKEPRHIKYFEALKAKYDPDVNEEVAKKIVNHLGIALNSKDASLVACSDETERNTVRDSWLKKKLGLEADDAKLDAKVMAVCEIMKDDKNKCRVAFYYLLAKAEDKLAAL
ncbi:MAG: DUF2853 family protein [Robiginitomaculum sp.]